jgi:hypothetical protein
MSDKKKLSKSLRHPVQNSAICMGFVFDDSLFPAETISNRKLIRAVCSKIFFQLANILKKMTINRKNRSLECF